MSHASPHLLAVEFPADADADGAFDQPADVESSTGCRQWSSLKRSSSPPPPREDDRERAKSLPAYGCL